MHRWAIVACVLGVWVCSAIAQDAATTAPSGTNALLHGQITYVPPPDWKVIGRRSDDRTIGYSLENPHAQLVISVTPQSSDVPRALGPKLAEQLKKVVADEAAKGNIESVMEPQLESDSRFLLRLHDKFRSHGTFGDRLQLFRGVGHNLVSVVVTAFNDDEGIARQVFDVGEGVAMSIALPGGPAAVRNLDDVRITLDQPKSSDKPAAYATSQPVAFHEAKLRIAPPAGWTAEPTGASTGLIVTWRDPADATNLITLAYHPVPAAAKSDPKLRDLAVEQLAAGEKPQFQAKDSKPVGQPKTVSDKRFLKKTTTDYKASDVEFRVGFRLLRVGDGILSVTDVALKDKADQIDELADKIASEARAMLK